LTCRDVDASALSGIWLHRQQADDLSSIDDDCTYSEEDDLDVAAADSAVSCVEPGCQFLDRADIAVFDTLLNVSSASDIELSTESNVTLLSMLTFDDVPTDDNATDILQCGGTADSGGFAETERGLCHVDETDGIFAADMNETVVAENDVSDTRPRCGSVIGSGTGDLTTSPVHHATNAFDVVQTPSLPNAREFPAKSKLSSQPWKSEATSLSSNDETRYIVEAAELISQAQEHEIGENYPAAYSHYRSGIEVLVKGVQSRHYV